MHRIKNLAVVAVLAAVAAPLSASALSTYLSTFNSKYGTSGTALDSCTTCHGSGGTSTFNPYGTDVRANIASGIASALTLAEPKDSDGDKVTNLDEITARTLPGDATSFPVAPAPKIAVAPTSLSFGTVAVGSSATQTATVSNTGTADLTVTSVSSCNGTSTEFTASPAAAFTVAPGGTQTLTVKYAPADATTDSGCIQLANNDSTDGTVQIAVSGTGQSQPTAVVDVDITRFSVPKRLDLSRGGTAAPKVSVVNAGTVAGTVTVHVEGSVTDAQGVAAIVYTASQDVTLAPAATAKVSFPAYAPAGPEVVTWTATVADQDPDVDASSATTKVVP
ncbi:choice-of-anchor D domain-containing protein [Anaeromyxobacter terrae]|uniref:choice-of-anchor D domain-containing protein n=1 Tax=Anaeromyxobacter terrae TaxID=2925406 RepID=UPI001F56EE66|nr:choice-of-anchor D domain-containing protein [Anaeromyxobacter sp. SG22]